MFTNNLNKKIHGILKKFISVNRFSGQYLNANQCTLKFGDIFYQWFEHHRLKLLGLEGT